MSRRASLALAALLLGGACAHDPARQTSAPEAPAPDEPLEVTRPPAPAVTLEDAGAEPRVTLRLTPRVGQEERWAMRMALTMSTAVDGVPAQALTLPPYTLSMTLRVMELTPDGDVRVRTRVDVVDLEEVNDPAIEAMAGLLGVELGKMRGLTLDTVLSPRGEVREQAVLSAGEAGADYQKVLENLHNGASNVAAVLPEEAVGVGARWTVEQAVVNPPLTLTQRSTYTVTAVEGGVAELAVELSTGAPAQAMESPESLPEAQISLTRLTGGGTGTLRFDPARLSATASMAVDLDILTSTTLDATTLATQVITHTTVQLTPVEP